MTALRQLRWGKSTFSSQLTTVMLLICAFVIFRPGPTHAQQWNGPDASGNISNTNTGKVGIGTASPATTLDVSANGNAQVNVTSTGANNVAQIQLIGRTAGANKSWYISARGGLETPNNRLSFFDPSTTERVTFAEGGNVGIGTTSPGAKLDVSGSTFLQYLTLTDPASFGVISFRETGGSSKGHIGMTGSGSGSSYVGGANSFQIWNAQNAPTVFGTNGAERMRIDAGGNVGIGTSTPHPLSKLHVAGSITVDGNINAKYQDVAEWVESSQALPAGTVVVLDHTKSNQVISSTQAYDTRVAGVISQQPGITLGESGDNKVLVATTGRVRMKVDATSSPIHIGDLLVTSDTSGAAMKSKPLNLNGVELHRPGTLIGKALEPLAKGTGEILVLLSLQ
jgi:hypothetical protein